MKTAFTIQHGIDPKSLDDAVELFDEAFREKSGLAIPDPVRRKKFLRGVFNPERAVAAVVNGRLVGFAGFQDSTGSFTGGLFGEGRRFRQFLRDLGFWQALRAAFVFGFFQRRWKPGELMMDTVAVSAECRGQGIGQALLDEAVRLAGERGFDAVRLVVVDSNPRARALYERIGFVPVAHHRFAWLKWLLGFGGATTMRKPLRAAKESGNQGGQPR